nr:nucleotide disphospho-sugar-binding domain-containing protein [Nocardioides zeae]
MNDPLVPDLVALLDRERPDLVLWEGFTWAGSIAATAAGVPHARVLSGSDLLTPARRRYRELAAAAGPAPDPVLGWIGGRLAALGYRGGADERLLTGLATVDYLPPALNPGIGSATAAPATTTLPVRYVPSNGRAVLPAWLRSRPRRPRVCVTLGQSSITNHGRYGVALRDLLLGVAELDVEVVATVPADLHASVGPLPAHVRLESFVPLDALAATCSAVVDHGGAATMCTVARHGVPQLVVPDDTYDEALLGDLLARSGAGLTCPPERAGAAAVTAAVDRLLHDGALRAGAARLAGEMAGMPPPAGLVPQLEALAARPVAA